MQRVVLVDDFEANLKLYSAIIERVLGDEAVVFADPREALNFLQNTEPSLVIVDYNMPGIDGIAFIRSLRKIPARAHTPVMMLTAETDRGLRSEALAAGADVFLTKPIATGEFVAHIRDLTAHPSLAGLPSITIRGTIDSRLADVRHEEKTILRLHRAIEAHDAGEARRMRTTRDISVVLAKELRLPQVDIDALQWGALVYDIGKLAIPEYILAHSGELSLESRSVINHHAEAGATILADPGSALLQRAETIARHHHERFDGTGYPFGLRGTMIPLLARIVAVADTFASLLCDRPHRQRLAFAHAMREVADQSGTQFDPSIIAALERARLSLALASD